jgi:ParB family chromosome partitioning protein
MVGIVRSRSAAEIPVDRIEPDPGQPREDFNPEALARLAESMRKRGQLQPIRVCWEEGRGVYVIIAGERRWRAARMAGLPTVSCMIHEGPIEPIEVLALQLVENCLREDLRPVEQAKAFRALMDGNGWSTHQLARELAISQPQVVRVLSLLDLPPELQAHVEVGEIAASIAYEISKAPEAQRADLATAALEGATRAEVIAARQGRSPRAPLHRASWRAPNGVTVTCTAPAELGPAETIAALQHAARAVKKSATTEAA